MTAEKEWYNVTNNPPGQKIENPRAYRCLSQRNSRPLMLASTQAKNWLIEWAFCDTELVTDGFISGYENRSVELYEYT
jgi:hypothetical protein